MDAVNLEQNDPRSGLSPSLHLESLRDYCAARTNYDALPTSARFNTRGAACKPAAEHCMLHNSADNCMCEFCLWFPKVFGLVGLFPLAPWLEAPFAVPVPLLCCLGGRCDFGEISLCCERDLRNNSMPHRIQSKARCCCHWSCQCKVVHDVRLSVADDHHCLMLSHIPPPPHPPSPPHTQSLIPPCGEANRGVEVSQVAK